MFITFTEMGRLYQHDTKLQKISRYVETTMESEEHFQFSAVVFLEAVIMHIRMVSN